MDLWIRSQDKERLVKVEYLEYFYKKVHYANEEKPREEHHNIGTYISNEQFIILGEYKTKERALEVLDEIQNGFIFDIKNFTYNETDLILKSRMLPMVYVMPKN